VAQIEKLDGVWKLHGDMTMQRILTLRENVNLLPKSGHLSIDFSQVTQVDTATVSFMFELLRNANKLGCQLRFNKLPANLRSLLTLYGVDELVK
jgi:phospholipid transport system transporter-binding protein